MSGPRGNFPPLANLVYPGVAELMSAEIINMMNAGPYGPTGPVGQLLYALAGLFSSGLSGPAPYLVNTMARGLAQPVWQGPSGWAGPLIQALAWQINGTGPVWGPGVWDYLMPGLVLPDGATG